MRNRSHDGCQCRSRLSSAKEVRKSVLEPYASKSSTRIAGKGCHGSAHYIMQSASDVFLGWLDTAAGRHFYVRQLNDAKLKPLVEIFDETTMEDYGRLCGWVLAHTHARSGDASMISGYLGSNDVFDEAIADFADAYERQNERDYQALRRAVRSGKIEARLES